ncbi:MAG: Flp family type IVb pilin [Methyloceanibacter sp.]|nr:Flp family type IVb pilin [Methyloceanibacter sp.]
MKLGWGSSQGRVALIARRFAADTSGATAIEYALITLIVVGIMVVVAQISGALNAMFAQLTSFVGG